MHQIDTIDFLPESYRLRYADRRALAGRLVVVGCAAALILLATYSQYRTRNKLKAELAEAHHRYEQAASVSGNVFSLEAELERDRAVAELLTYLRHPWPTTRVLAALTEQLPKTMMLESISLSRERVAPRAPATRDRRRTEQPADAPPPSPSEMVRQTLATLRSQRDTAPAVVSLTGLTTDNADLHTYLSALGRQRIVSRAQLNSVQRVELASGEAFRFVLEVELAPGYSQPGGPRSEQTARHTPHREPPERSADR